MEPRHQDDVPDLQAVVVRQHHGKSDTVTVRQIVSLPPFLPAVVRVELAVVHSSGGRDELGQPDHHLLGPDHHVRDIEVSCSSYLALFPK